MYGRFASPDPARDQHFEDTQSWNIYSYVRNNPVMLTDPTGMKVPWYLGGNSAFVDKALDSLYSLTVTHNPGYQAVAQVTDVVSSTINAVGNKDLPMLSNLGKDAEKGAGATDLLVSRSMEVPTQVMAGEVGGNLIGRGAGALEKAITRTASAESSSLGAIPQKVVDTLKVVSETGQAPTGFKGGRTFANDGRGGGAVLPQADSSGAAVTYKEWDVNPFTKGVNRGAERLVTGSDGNAYYTFDHYQTFTRVPQ